MTTLARLAPAANLPRPSLRLVEPPAAPAEADTTARADAYWEAASDEIRLAFNLGYDGEDPAVPQWLHASDKMAWARALATGRVNGRLDDAGELGEEHGLAMADPDLSGCFDDAERLCYLKGWAKGALLYKARDDASFSDHIRELEERHNAHVDSLAYAV